MAYYVITRTYIEDPNAKAELLEMVNSSNAIFRKQPGLIELKSLMAENETHLSTYLVWEDQKSHLDCMESKDFRNVTADWTGLMQKGKIRFELETYQPLK